MKRMLVILLVVTMFALLFSGCQDTKQPEKTQTTQFSAPVAMAAFGGSVVEGVPLSEPKDLKFTGTSQIETVSVLVGDNDRSYTSRTLSGYDSEMTFTLTGVTPNAPAMIDIEEIHQRTDGSIAYLVYVNGTEVYGRTYVPISEGPNHAYFDISADVVGSTGELTVRLVNKTDGKVRFSRIWAISNPEETAQQQKIAKKMDVVLMLNYLPSDLDYNYLTELVKSYQCDNMYNVGLCWEINYLMWGKIKTEEFLNNVLNASMLTGAPLYLGINSWWGGTADSMDGQGGIWQDVQYQQITYDHNNRAGRGNWQLSTPNEFSNTPWLTMNNDYYNSVRIQRIQETVKYLQLRTAELALAGKELPAIHLYTENEPFYWPIHWTQYEFNNYADGVGDFSQWVMEDAAKDGITLDPTDGLSEEEAMWMYRNLHTYISEVGAAMAEGLGYNYITVKDGVVQYPTEQMVSDSYSHSPIHAIYPNWDPNQRGWENHVLDSIHFGGEWSVYQNADASRAFDYLLAYGSYSNINAERAGFPGGFDSTDFRVLSQCYAYGLDGVVIYNVLADTDQQNVIGVSNMGSEPMEVRFFEARPVFESDFSLRTAYAQGSVLTDISGMRWDGMVITPDSQDGGSLTYHIRNAQQYTTGLRVNTIGSFADPNGRMEVFAGTAPDAMQSLGVYDNANQDITIDTGLYADSEELYIQIKVFGENMTSVQMAGLALSKVGIYRSGITNGCTDGSVYTHDQNRIRCQIIAARADAERLMARYVARAGGSLTTQQQKDAFNAAYELYAQGRYGEAFTSISQSISQLLPATFVVSGYGQLGTYPVEITADSNAKVMVTLKEVSENAVRFSLSSSSDAQITVSLLTESGAWGMQKQEDGDWLISAGDVAPSNGKATFQISEKGRVAKQIPLEFEARILTTDPNTLTVRSQDPNVTDYCYYGLFQFSSDVEIYRDIDGTPKENMAASNELALMPGDYVQVKRNEMGLVTQVYAWYGIITGTVEAVEEMSLTGEISNPFVTIRAADGTTKRLEIGAESLLHFTGATGEMGKLALVESVGLQVGQQVTVTYCPYTVNGRTRIIEITD